ncbi:MAG: glycosyltransferase [Actinomycetota bacterium]|nr:glycosyltransferase [Actinomycetota bacterium]
MSTGPARISAGDARVKVLATPKDPNPYQELLYREVAREGAVVRYATGPTPSQTVNLLLAPLVLAVQRARGFRILHIHWVFQFDIPWARGARPARVVMQWWFGLYLLVAARLGFRIVWTAHDILPHAPVFRDDEKAHALLRERADVVIALSPATAAQLVELGARDVRVVPFGPYGGAVPGAPTGEDARELLHLEVEDFVVVSIGRQEHYKGADLLLEAASEAAPGSRLVVLLAGVCSDPRFRARLDELAGRAGARARVRLEWVPDEELVTYFAAADFAAYPFREVTNSSSVLLAQSFGVPVIIPNLPSLADVAAGSVIRYEPGEFRSAVERAEALGDAERAQMGRRAREHACGVTWNDVARATMDAYSDALGRPSARLREVVGHEGHARTGPAARAARDST